jgi:hypothetical protein
MMCKKKLFCFVVIVFLFILPFVLGLGVSPARRTIDFVPNQVLDGSLKIINSDDVDRELVVSVRGSLADSIRLDNRRVQLKAGQKEAFIGYKLNIVQDLSPGLHVGEIVISEEMSEVSDDDTIVGATLTLVSQIYVYVLYPGKYADVVLNVDSAERSEDVLFKFSVVSKGEFDLMNVYANVDVYNEFGAKVDSFNTKSVSIKSNQKSDIIHKWDKSGVEVGRYNARVTLIYDEDSKTLEEFFQVGLKNLELNQISVSNFRLGEIVKMELLVENKWSENFERVHTQMQIYGSKKEVLADFNSPDMTIEALSKKVLVSYWDSAGMREGTYDSKVTIHYSEGKTTDTNLQLVVKSNSLEVIGLGYVLLDGGGDFDLSENMVMILLIVIGVLVLLNLLWFFILRRYMQKKS